MYSFPLSDTALLEKLLSTFPDFSPHKSCRRQLYRWVTQVRSKDELWQLQLQGLWLNPVFQVQESLLTQEGSIPIKDFGFFCPQVVMKGFALRQEQRAPIKWPHILLLLGQV